MSHDAYPNWLDYDRQYIWHPYSAFASDQPLYPVKSAKGVELHLSDGRTLVDGMASWWCVIHGYDHPLLKQAMKDQIDRLPHVMFGGLTHEPAALLAKKLVELTPAGLQSVFFTDSGSVAVEAAMKMAVQYWQARGKSAKQRFVSFYQGYHGDTLGAMSVCDPITGMHTLFNDLLAQQRFMPKPQPGFKEACSAEHLAQVKACLEQHHAAIAAIIIEPIVQGAGGMRFYAPGFLQRLRTLCDEYEVLLIFDEIATGFGRTGKWFAAEHAATSPDILCLGKALTGGYMTLAATLCTQEIAGSISASEPGVFMHGPTFMANPLACATALASIHLLETRNWQAEVSTIEHHFEQALRPCEQLPWVKEVRVLGAIGVIETTRPVDMQTFVPRCIEAGIWVRPFGCLVYLMPPFVINQVQLHHLSDALATILQAEDILQPT